MSRANDSAYPIPAVVYPNGNWDRGTPGMTVREEFAKAALTGICMEANGETYSPEGAAKRARAMADALLAELAKPVDLAPALAESIAIVRERAELHAALAELLELYPMPGESKVERFERVAEMFHRETGCIAPGKDIAAASSGSMTDEERGKRWEDWYNARADKARAVLAKVKP